MTVDLLPSPSARASSRPAPSVDRMPAAAPHDRLELWTHAGHDCAYCSGPETD